LDFTRTLLGLLGQNLDFAWTTQTLLRLHGGG
jgi:hypothetical protein